MTSRTVALTTLALTLSACSGEDARPPRGGAPNDASGDQRDSGGSDHDAAIDAGDASTLRDSSLEGGPRDSASESDADAARTDSGEPFPDPDGGDEPPDASGEQTCPTNPTWGPGQRLSISTAEDDVFGSVSGSAMSIAWRSESSGRYYYADRSSPGGDFVRVAAVPDAYGSFAPDRAALSADGRRLVLVRQDRRAFLELRRDAIGTDFDPPVVGPFAPIAEYGSSAPAGELFGDPVLASDDRAFVYSVYGNGRAQTIFLTTRLFASDSWQAGRSMLADARVSASASGRARPTALTWYNAELFYWHEADATERVASINWATRALASVTELGQKRFATASADCQTLYYSAPGSEGIDLFWAARL